MQASVDDREAARLQALHDQAILDTPPEADFDDLAYLAAEVCGAPVALITFVDRDRLWFKARVGLGAREWPRSAGFCPLAIEQEGLLLIRDAQADPLLRERAAAAKDLPACFYAGVPLVTADGQAIGTLCVLDHVPRELQDWQQGALKMLARLVMRELQIRQVRRDLDRRRSEAIGTLAGGLAHELNHLLALLQEEVHILETRTAPDDPTRAVLQRGLEGARRAAALTRELLSASRNNSPAPQFVDLNELIARLGPEWQERLGGAVRLRLRLDPGLARVKADPAQISRALRTLVENVSEALPPGADLIVATGGVEVDGEPGGRYAAVSIGDPLGEVVAGEGGRLLEPGGTGSEDLDRAGLGLLMAHGVVAQNGGRLQMLARQGREARPRILLPAVAAEVE
ncbi:MAG TPA: GAF domain-containing protein [Candidatus Cryosericum sp.]|nr:GAF domain-containing protein [Candidatus Cryosericum sp.]